MCGGGENVGVLLHSYPTASASRVLGCRCVSPCQAKFSINIKKIKYIHSDPGTRFQAFLGSLLSPQRLQLYCNLTLTLIFQNCRLGWGMPFLSIHCWVMWSASMSHGQTCFPGPLSAGSCVGDWKRGTPVGSNKRGHWAAAPSGGTPPKPWFLPVHSNSSAFSGPGGYHAPEERLMEGPVQAVVSPACGHWAPGNYVHVD